MTHALDSPTSAASTAPAAAAPATREAPLANLRDLGGTPVAYGKIRERALWRADDISISPYEEVAELADHGLTAVLDLRSDEELDRHRLAAPATVVHHHLPLTQRTADPEAMRAMVSEVRTPADVGRWYATLFQQQTPRLIQGLRLIADAEGGVLFHCAAGKDRTGVLAATILSVLGADTDVIVADYAATAANLTGIFHRLGILRPLADASAGNAESVLGADHPMLGAVADSMEIMLAELGAAAGITSHLLDHGLEGDELVRLRAKLVV